MKKLLLKDLALKAAWTAASIVVVGAFGLLFFHSEPKESLEPSKPAPQVLSEETLKKEKPKYKPPTFEPTKPSSPKPSYQDPDPIVDCTFEKSGKIYTIHQSECNQYIDCEVYGVYTPMKKEACKQAQDAAYQEGLAYKEASDRAQEAYEEAVKEYGDAITEQTEAWIEWQKAEHNAAMQEIIDGIGEGDYSDLYDYGNIDSSSRDYYGDDYSSVQTQEGRCQEFEEKKRAALARYGGTTGTADFIIQQLEQEYPDCTN